MPLAVAKLREASRFSTEEPDSYRGIRSGRVLTIRKFVFSPFRVIDALNVSALASD
jgi:hypothetical protein